MKIELKNTDCDIVFDVTSTLFDFKLKNIFDELKSSGCESAIIELPNNKYIVWLLNNTYQYGNVSNLDGEFRQVEGLIGWQSADNCVTASGSYQYYIKKDSCVMLTREDAEAAMAAWNDWYKKVEKEKYKIYYLKVWGFKQFLFHLQPHTSEAVGGRGALNMKIELKNTDVGVGCPEGDSRCIAKHEG